MDINFTGISNVRILRNKPTAGYGSIYVRALDRQANGNLFKQDYKLILDITNDSNGADFDEFLTALSKSGRGLNTTYSENPNKIELFMRKYDVQDDITGINSIALFKINGENVSLGSRKGLALYTYLAKLTRQIKKSPLITEAQSKCVDLFNQMIHKEAVEFIDFM